MRSGVSLLFAGVLLVGCGAEQPEATSGSPEAAATSAAPSSEATAAAAPTTTTDVPDVLQVGQTAQYEGLDVTVSELQPFTPSQTAFGYQPGQRAVRLLVTVTNTGERPFDLALTTVSARAAESGAQAEPIFDSEGGVESLLTGTVEPGRNAQADFAFALPPEAGAVDIEVQPDAGIQYDSTTWTASLP